jgi:uncharacterized protein
MQFHNNYGGMLMESSISGDKKIENGISVWGSIIIILMIFGAQILAYFVIKTFLFTIDGITGIKINLRNEYIVGYAIIIAFIIVYKYLMRKNMYEIKFIKRFNFKICLCCFFIYIGYILLYSNSIALIIANLPSEKWVKNMTAVPLNVPFTLCTRALISPIFEEIFFRGIILEQLLIRYKPIIAITTSALLFALLHMNLTQGVNAFLIGIIFGIIYLKTRSLALCMILHVTNNVFSPLLKYIYMNPSNIMLSLGIIILPLSLYFFKGLTKDKKAIIDTNKKEESTQIASK